jgi:hypothetical protein
VLSQHQCAVIVGALAAFGLHIKSYTIFRKEKGIGGRIGEISGCRIEGRWTWMHTTLLRPGGAGGAQETYKCSKRCLKQPEQNEYHQVYFNFISYLLNESKPIVALSDNSPLEISRSKRRFTLANTNFRMV